MSRVSLRLMMFIFTLLLGVSAVAADRSQSLLSDSASDEAVVPLLNESFEGGTLPAGWQVIGLPGWRFDNPKGRPNATGGFGSLAIADSDHAGYVTMDTELRTPSLNFSGHTTVEMSFKAYFFPHLNSTADVDVSINGGITWTTIWRQTGATYQGITTLNVPQAVGQSNVIFRFRYYNAYYSWYWQLDDVVVPDAQTAGAPTAPGPLTAATAPSSVNLIWTDNSSNETSFVIERSPDGISGWVGVGQVGPGITSYTHQNVACGTIGYYRVKATNGAAQSGYSNSAIAVMSTCPPSSMGINENFNASQNLPPGWTTVGGAWDLTQPNTTGGTGNAVWRGPNYLTYSELRTPVFNMTGVNAVLLTFKTDSLIYANQALIQKLDIGISQDAGATWTTIWSRASTVRGTINIDLTPWAANHPSLMVQFVPTIPYNGSFWQIDDVVINAMLLPTTPTGLTTTLTDSSDVILSWHGDPGSKYKVERSTNGGATWFQIADITNGATTFIDTNVNSFTLYHYRVRAYSPAGQSAASTVAGITTDDRSIQYVDVTISLHAAAVLTTAADRAKYENGINYFADALFEMSNGAARLRKVTFYRNGQNFNSAHIQWISQCHPNAHPGGYILPNTGRRLEMCDTFGATSFLANENSWKAAGATLGHEWGHFYFGLYDEYRGGDPMPAWIGTPRSTDINTSVSIMNTQWNGFNDYRYLNFSAPAPASQFSLVTAQGRVFGASGWETLGRFKAADPQNPEAALRPYWRPIMEAAPAANAMPQIDLPNPLARSSLEIVWVPGFGVPRNSVGSEAMLGAVNHHVIEIVIDRSAQMAANGHLDEVKMAVESLIDGTEVGDTVGIVAYDGTAAVVQPLTDIVDQTTRDTLIAAVDGIMAGNAEAAGGDALQLALTELTATNVPTNTGRVAYFITHGGDTVGAHAVTATPGFNTADIPIHVFGFDPHDGDENELRHVAELTEGTYTTIHNALDLRRALTLAYHDGSLGHDVTVAHDKADVAAGETFTVPIAFDSTMSEIDFEITYLAEPLSATVSVIDPLGNPTPVDPLNDCDTDGSGTSAHTTCTVIFSGPVGDWEISVTAVSDLHLQYHVTGTAFDTDSTYEAHLSTRGGDVVAYPHPMVAYASATRGHPIAGLTATGWVREADGNVIPVHFHDDGVAPDAIADDGTYSAYVDYTESGEHWISVQFDNFAGTGFYTERGLAITIPRDLPTVSEDFERYAEHQVTVVDWQPDDHTDWATNPAWPPTSLPVDNTAIPGRIDHPGDADIFEVVVPLDYTESTLGIRINHLGLGMDPDILIFSEDYAWQHEHFLVDPTNDDVLFVAVNVTPGERFYVEVLDYDPAATDGVYSVSAGPHLWSDPVARVKQPYTGSLPIIFKETP